MISGNIDKKDVIDNKVFWKTVKAFLGNKEMAQKEKES